jgi:hypothetical protein
MKLPQIKNLLLWSAVVISCSPALCFGATTDADTKQLIDYIGGYYKSLILPIGTVLAGFMIMFGGIRYAISAGEPGKVGQAKELIVGAITGEVLLLSAWAIISIIAS